MSPRKRKLQRAGSRWRVLVHEMLPHGWSGDSYHIASDRKLGGGVGEDHSTEADGRTYWSRNIELPGTEFDEIVVGSFCHMEQMDTGYWWLDVGGVTIHVRADRDGQPLSVTVHGPGDYAEPVDGVKYECVWSHDD